MPSVGDHFVQAHRAARTRQRAGVSKPVSNRRHGLRHRFRPDGSQDRARIVAEAELRFAESRFVLALGGRHILRGRIDRRRIALRGVGLRIIARGADDFRNRPALGIVGVEQGVRSFAGRHESKLPSQIERVLNPPVHPVAFDGAAGVGRVAGEQYAP